MWLSPRVTSSHDKQKQASCLLFSVDLKKVEYKKIVKRKASRSGWQKRIMFSLVYSKKTQKSSWTEVPNKIIDDQFLSCQEKMVLIVLQRYTFKKNNCYPSVSTIAHGANVRIQNVYKILKGLETKRFIKKHLRPGFATIYEILNFGI